MTRNQSLHSRLGWPEMTFAYTQIVIGCLIAGAAYPLFLTPNRIAPGGLTGVATILNHYFSLPVGAVSFALNVPLFLLGWRSVGGRFVLRTFFATMLFSAAIDLLPLPNVTDDAMLAAICGGAMSGVGFGLIMRGGATTGGTDMLARIVHHRFPFITVGVFLFAIDFVVVAAAGLTIGSVEALYAFITIYLQSRVIDVVMVGFTANKACFIMTDRWEEITDRVLHDMERGVTQLKARGAYTMQERPLILCVVSRSELTQLKDIVSQVDDRAFMFVTEAFEALGEGFQSLNKGT